MAKKSVGTSKKSKSDSFQPKTRAMKSWKKKYLTGDQSENDSITTKTPEEKEKIIEDDLEKILSNTKTLSPNEFHKMICKILMVMAVIGGFFAFIGYTLAPESCASHEDTIWETLGIALFYISVFGVPINIIIWLISLFNSNVDSPQILVWVFFHTVVVIISMVIFAEYIIQDMFCGCFGFPGEDCS